MNAHIRDKHPGKENPWLEKKPVKKYRAKKKKWKTKEPIFRAIAESIFSNIESLTIDLRQGDGKLLIQTNDQKLQYLNVLSKSLDSLEKEMKKDFKNREEEMRVDSSDITQNITPTQRPKLIDYADALTRFYCLNCDRPMEGGPDPGSHLCVHCSLMYDSHGNAI